MKGTSTSTLVGPTLLCILDGVGLNPKKEGNAVALASTPTLDNLFAHYPHSTLATHGRSVGLPDGQMGNSEVGHLNIGAGRVVKQWLVRIEEAFQGGSVQGSPIFSAFLQNILSDEKSGITNIHLIGLCSFGGVHSHLNHLFELLKLLDRELARKASPQKWKILLHLISDGRDVAPQQFLKDLSVIERHVQPYGEQIVLASLSGRYFAMDRDNRMERTERAYKVILGGNEKFPLQKAKDQFSYVRSLVQEWYEQGVTDEFFPSTQLSSFTLNSDDALIFWNFRSDRMRQIVRALTQASFTGFERTTPPVTADRVLCFAEYDQTFHLPVLFPTETITNHLGQVLSSAGRTQLRAAETEKYPHVTYFLNGGDEAVCEGEDRLLVPSPKEVKTYDEKPEMSAYPLTEKVVADIQSGKHDCIILNFANGDMVGHTGVLAAAIKAVETVDSCLGALLDAIQSKNGSALIIADHGNAELMIDPETGGPHTAHTTFPVPVILFGEIAKSYTLRDGGALSDVAPTLLEIMGIPKPREMTGSSLLSLRDLLSTRAKG